MGEGLAVVLVFLMIGLTFGQPAEDGKSRVKPLRMHTFDTAHGEPLLLKKSLDLDSEVLVAQGSVN